MIGAVIATACAPRPARPASRSLEAGVAIALYGTGDPDTAYAVVDDRRWVESSGHELALDRIDPGASLASLVIEPAGAEPLAITRCTRDVLPVVPAAVPAAVLPLHAASAELPPSVDAEAQAVPAPPRMAAPAATLEAVAPTVHCAIAGPPGRRLVRIMYVSRTLGYRTQHDVAMVTPDRARLVTRFAIATPAWHEHAAITVFDGRPGGERAPTELARGQVALDGSIAILAVPPRELAARLRWVYDGAIATPELDASDAAWNAGSTRAVWVWLEVPHAALSRGPARVHVELPGEPIRDLELASASRGAPGSGDPGLLRLPLWADGALSGTRQRLSDPGFDPDAANGALAERLMMSIANLGDAPRDVWIEEHLRPSRRHTLAHAWPKSPATSGDLVRERVTVRPRAIVRVGYTVTYEF